MKGCICVQKNQCHFYVNDNQNNDGDRGKDNDYYGDRSGMPWGRMVMVMLMNVTITITIMRMQMKIISKIIILDNYKLIANKG